MPDAPAPRPAATILPLRDGESGLEVLMVRRNLNSDFVCGAYVFPGGALDASDATRPGLGLDDPAASRRLGLASGGLAYYHAAVRELFEEAGLLLAATPAGDVGAVVRHRAELNADRVRVNAHEDDFDAVLGRYGLVVNLRGVAYLSHWVTPLGQPRRYDTRFFVVAAPADQVAGHDEGETVAHRWIRPRDALDAARRGEMTIILPTQRNLALIAELESAHDVVAFAHAQREVVRIEPRVVERDGEVLIVVPGDPGYDD